MIAIAVLAAAVTAGLVVWLTGRGTDESNASPAGAPAGATEPTTSAPGGGTTTETGATTETGTTTEEEVPARLDAIVPASLWADCQVQTVPDPNALETAVCLPAQNTGKFEPLPLADIAVPEWQDGERGVRRRPGGRGRPHRHKDLLALLLDR